MKNRYAVIISLVIIFLGCNRKDFYCPGIGKGDDKTDCVTGRYYGFVHFEAQTSTGEIIDSIFTKSIVVEKYNEKSISINNLWGQVHTLYNNEDWFFKDNVTSMVIEATYYPESDSIVAIRNIGEKMNGDYTFYSFFGRK